jgi:hypothetical protein
VFIISIHALSIPSTKLTVPVSRHDGLQKRRVNMYTPGREWEAYVNDYEDVADGFMELVPGEQPGGRTRPVQGPEVRLREELERAVEMAQFAVDWIEALPNAEYWRFAEWQNWFGTTTIVLPKG